MWLVHLKSALFQHTLKFVYDISSRISAFLSLPKQLSAVHRGIKAASLNGPHRPAWSSLFKALTEDVFHRVIDKLLQVIRQHYRLVHQVAVTFDNFSQALA